MPDDELNGHSPASPKRGKSSGTQAKTGRSSARPSSGAAKPRKSAAQRAAAESTQRTQPMQPVNAAMQTGYPSAGITGRNVPVSQQQPFTHTAPQPAYPQNWSSSQPRFYPQQDPGWQQGYPAQKNAYPSQQGYHTGQQPIPRQGFATGQQPVTHAGFAPGQQPPMQPTGTRQGSSGPSPKRRSAPARKNRKKSIKLPQIPSRILHYLMLAAVLIVLVSVSILVANNVQEKRRAEAITAEVNMYNSVFCQGVYVDGIHLGGMTPDEAYAAVNGQASQRRDAWRVQLVFQGQLIADINASQLGMNFDVYDTLNEAWAQGHTGSITERKAAMDELMITPYHGYSALPSSDNSVLDIMLNDVANSFYIPAQDATVLSFDATRSDPFTYSDEVVGRYLDVAPVKAQLYEMVSTMTSGIIELVPTYVQPSVTVANLTSTVVTVRATATTDISTSSTENRNNNIIEAFRRINGTVIMPGEVFSFNGIVGERTLKNGFYMAPEYTYGQEVMGVGGGVCQASTTVYQAAVRAGMEIVKRDPHSLEVRYAAWGTDATVNSTRGHEVDLKFRNNTPYPIYIKAGVESKEGNRTRLITRVTIYGVYMGDGVSYNFATELENLPPPEEAEIQVDKNGEYVIYDDETYIYQEAKEGLRVTSYQVRYISGFEQERTFLDTDTYKPKPQIIYIGATPRPIDWTPAPE